MGRPLASRQASQISLAKKHREQISLAVESLLVRRVRRPSRIRRLPNPKNQNNQIRWRDYIT
jgi:hypothetical protein